MNILIVRLSAIGDVTHGLPVLAALKERYPDSKIGWVVEELSAPLLKNHPMLDKLYIIPKKRWRNAFFKNFRNEVVPFFKDIKSYGWDAAIDMQGLSKSGAAAFFSGAKTRIGFGGEDSLEINRFFINKKIIPPKEFKHVVQKNLSLLSALDITNPKIRFPLAPDNDGDEWARQYLGSLGWESGGFVIINIGGGWKTKAAFPHTLAKCAALIIKQTSKKIMFIWGPGEEESLKTISEEMKCYDANLWQAAPKTTLMQSIALNKYAALYIGADTGPTHLAAAAGIPVVSYFGASDSRRNSPLHAGDSVNDLAQSLRKIILIQRFEHPCVPCWKKVCPLSSEEYLRCLKSISHEELADAACRLIMKSGDNN